MLISKVIQNVKDYCKGSWMGVKIDDEKTRDKVLFGETDKECTGIVTTIYASVDVIRKAHELGANLIIAHEALLWNRGDTRDWLEESENRTYLAKKKLMEDCGITVWRCHDYIHSGIPHNGGYIDGIFYGLARVTGWDDAKIYSDTLESALYLECEPTTPRKVAELIREKWHLSNMKCIGNMDARVTKIMICGHIGEGMNIRPLITRVDKEDINLLLPLELIDFTLSEYVKDSGQLGYDRAILAPGHFNLEEPGMEYMVNWLPEAVKADIPVNYVQAGDMYTYL